VTYAVEHASAYADILAAGTAVTFTKVTLGRDPLTGASTKTTATVSGAAISVRGAKRAAMGRLFAELNLTERTAVALLFAPATYGELPQLDATTTWAGKKVTVKWVDPLDPDGTPIISRVICEV
jgi:hypothetical protein